VYVLRLHVRFLRLHVRFLRTRFGQTQVDDRGKRKMKEETHQAQAMRKKSTFRRS